MAVSIYLLSLLMVRLTPSSPQTGIMRTLSGLQTVDSFVSAQSGAVVTGCMSCVSMGPRRQKYLQGKGGFFSRSGQRNDGVDMRVC